MSRLIALAATMVTMTPGHVRHQAGGLPVHVELRLAGDRKSFKSGEPIRLQMALTADRDGFFVDTLGMDEASDILSVAPESGVFRLPKYGWRDVVTATKLSRVPVVLDLTANYWMRFDKSGDYTVSLQTRRVSTVGPDGSSASSTRITVDTSPVTFHVDLPSETDEQRLVDGAVVDLQNAVSQEAEQQTRAAEGLAFLAGDSAAVEKHRQYRAMFAARSWTACEVLRRGFYMSRRPQLIVDLFEGELADLGKPATQTLISDVVNLRLWSDNPLARPSVPFLPTRGGSDPESVLRARYVQQVHESLPNRSGVSMLQSAMTVLAESGLKPPADVVALIVDNFDQFPIDDETRLATQFWSQIKSPKLGPALLAMLPRVDRSSRQALLKSLANLSPALAHDPIEAELRDPGSFLGVSLGDELLRAFPDDAFRAAGPTVVAAIRALIAAPKEGPESYRLQMKASLLPRIVGPELAPDVRAIYRQYGDTLRRDTKAYFLAYLTRWDYDTSAGMIDLALRSEKEDPGWLLYRVTETAYSPRIDAIVKERLLSDSAADASSAASILGRRGEAQDRSLIEDRLSRLQAELRGRPQTGGTEIKDAYEPQFIAVLLGSKRWTLTAADRDRLQAACVTKACLDAFGPRKDVKR